MALLRMLGQRTVIFHCMEHEPFTAKKNVVQDAGKFWESKFQNLDFDQIFTSLKQHAETALQCLLLLLN